MGCKKPPLNEHSQFSPSLQSTFDFGITVMFAKIKLFCRNYSSSVILNSIGNIFSPLCIARVTILSTMMISTLLILERTLVKVYFMEEFPYKLFNWRNSLMMFVFVITASSGYMIIFSSKHNITNCSIIYSDFGWPLLIMLGIFWCLVIVSSISIWVNICKNFKEFGNTGLQKYHGNVERSQTSIMMKPCKEREAIIKSTIRMISYTFHYIVPCKLNY